MDPEWVAEFVAKANDCINLNLVRPIISTHNATPTDKPSMPNKKKRILPEPFHPEFTYPIFGEEEAIFGYRGLKINLDFYANDLLPSLDIRYDEKWKQIGETEAMDITEKLREFLPAYVTDPEENVTPALPDPTAKSWKPPGERIYSYSQDGSEYSIFQTTLADPVAREMFRRMQIFVTLYIEGGTQQDLDDQDWTMERWTLFLLYQVKHDRGNNQDVYTLAGFATSYRLWIFPTLEVMRATKSLPSSPPGSKEEKDTYTPPLLRQDPVTHMYTDAFSPLEAPSRERISQFIILPPFQGQSLGARLYNAMFHFFIGKPYIYEITVEDPNEAFDDMRDYCDLAYLRTLLAFQNLSLPSTLPSETLKKNAEIPRDLIIAPETTLTALRHESKITPRQFDRMVELYLLSTIPPLHRSPARITRKEKSANENDRKYYFWRLALKDRLYRHNADQLAQLDKDERVEKIEMAANSVEDNYDRLLEVMEKRAGWTDGGRYLLEGGDPQNGDGEETAIPSRSKRKRVVSLADDDDDDDDEGADTDASKRPRVDRP
ncbi:acyl-CoA N-acyltransferase [Delitschia confertaspora ATCC 74209]|uniref:Histone acetyltransferase type B catalytic subunit n=1 Tax=Delitschia confertaspora ATCC 74209 TaxID=1513339 RepID=A0A9P4JMC0_9PLEO|nr:acyl-CoA N-acyltransferase [Delitschia confertaspora ATCC 74209]